MVAGPQNTKSSESLKVAIIDYGMGNVRSVQGALERLGCESVITSDAEVISRANALILPGVGAFGMAMENLHEAGLVEILNNEVLIHKKPILGICLGMQLFAEISHELGTHKGLGWIPGHVVHIERTTPDLSIPHVGWNNVFVDGKSPLFERVGNSAHFYFDHSYHFKCEAPYVMSRVAYGDQLVSGVRRDHIVGVQFHPEKSQTTGLKLLRNFLNGAAHA